MVPLAAALFTAALALFGKVLFDLWSTYRERRGIAGALAGEIRAYVDLLNPAMSSAAYRRLASLDRETRLRCLRAFPALPTNHPAFDKLAEKIGLLPQRAAYGVSRIYNVVTGMRLLLSSMSFQGFLDADDSYQRGRIIFVADSMEREIEAARDLIQELECISRQSLWHFVGGYEP